MGDDGKEDNDVSHNNPFHRSQFLDFGCDVYNAHDSIEEVVRSR